MANFYEVQISKLEITSTTDRYYIFDVYFKYSKNMFGFGTKDGKIQCSRMKDLNYHPDMKIPLEHSINLENGERLYNSLGLHIDDAVNPLLEIEILNGRLGNQTNT